MSNAEVKIKVEESDGNYIFSSNKELNGDNLVYDLNSVKEIFELNPIPAIDISTERGNQKLSFDVKYDANNGNFIVAMYLDREEVASEILTKVDMLDMLIEAYTKNTYITSNPKLSAKTSKMMNGYVVNLLKEGKIPRMKFALEGKGVIKYGRQTVALFERAMFNPLESSVLICESVGGIPEDTALDFIIETSIGVTIDLKGIYAKHNSEVGQVMDIEYKELHLPIEKGNLIEEMNLSRNEEFIHSNTLKVLSSHELLVGPASSVIKACVQELNKTDNDGMITFIRDKKDKIFANDAEDHLIDQVEDLFDDLF